VQFIPILGPMLGAAVTLLIALFSGYDLIAWLIVALLVYRAVVDYVIYPMLISSQISLHPLFVMFGVFAGQQLAGVPGAFFALPALAMFRIFFRHIVLRKRVGAANDAADGDVEMSEYNESVDEVRRRRHHCYFLLI
jgi:predicted PurR-regulated permease PerM